jgi:transaldolase/glucose-6-phosphate isomerase
MTNPLVAVQEFGLSVWYDNIRRGLITSGELQEMIDNDGLLGITSNPAIFEKAIAGSVDYDDSLREFLGKGSRDAKEVYEHLAIEDIRSAADLLLPVHKKTNGVDGYVSFEVSPYLAKDTEGTIEEARRLNAVIARDNVMIKVPATPEGIPAIETLVADGINLNVTLLFSLDVYEQTIEAYYTGLEKLIEKGGDPSKIASVASFFLSRIDTVVDQKIEEALDATSDKERRGRLKGLLGKVAIASAKLAYARYQERTNSDRWKALAAKGARPQRLLWASTSTKNPKYPVTMYVDMLIGPDTVNTIPASTFDAFRAEGTVALTLTENMDEARATIETLSEVGISLGDATDFLLDQGVTKFADPFDKLLGSVEKKRQSFLEGEFATQKWNAGADGDAVKAELEAWRKESKVRRLWKKDTSLWTGSDENRWLGWLDVVGDQLDHLEPFERIAKDVRDTGFTHILLLGMGGSSLCPWLLRETFGKRDGAPELHVLDSIVPAQIKTAEKSVDLPKTLFIVSSKSGTTTEPNDLLRYFLEKVGHEGSQFVAITDPGSALHKLAKEKRFRYIHHGVPDIGGRYSALSHFGMIPAAAMGLPLKEFLDSTEIMVQSCSSVVPPACNPGVVLGAILGTLAKKGRDKITVITSPALHALGAWVEQLVAESTGKMGKGLIPINGESLGTPDLYGNDRVFVYVRGRETGSGEQDAKMDELERAGHPVVRINLEGKRELGQEFFRWQMATAVAGSILGINPFDQPDVESAKVAARNLLEAYEETGELPEEKPLFEEGSIRVFGGNGGETLADILESHLSLIQPGDWFAVNAFLEMKEEFNRHLDDIRLAVRDAKKVATTVGYGPRFLHSTGQLHKGGPDTGVFLQITSEDAEDLPVPGRKYTFGVLKRAQERGDFNVLAERKRRLLRVHLGADVGADLAKLCRIVQKVMGKA